jgi:hypothetical protein
MSANETCVAALYGAENVETDAALGVPSSATDQLKEVPEAGVEDPTLAVLASLSSLSTPAAATGLAALV